MKKLLLVLFVATVLIFPQELPFHKGVNLTGWFQTDSPQSIQFSKFTKKDFERIKSLGADVIRLPINLHFMTSGSPGYTLDPLFVYLLDEVISWAEEFEINLILDNHTFDVTQSTGVNIDQVLIPVWTQMAEHYKERSTYIYYEILNEPHGITDQRWNQIQLEVVEAIREIDTVHTIIVGPANWNSYNNLSQMPVYPDTNLIYTFHFYDPFIFTHQGASWTDPSMVPLAGVPFPYNSSAMPECPDGLDTTWVKNSIDNYMNEGTEARVKSLINIAYNFSSSRNVKVFCGEFGVLMNNAPFNDRNYWYQVIREHLESKNIPWTIWDYKGGFGVFEKDSYELFDYDLNMPLLTSLGFNEPPQQEYVLEPDTVGFEIYADFVGENISAYGSGTTNFLSGNPQSGMFALYWADAVQYNSISFQFTPVKDLSQLVSEDYIIDFYFKSFTKLNYDIRFMDTKENESDHPWRMHYTIDTSDFIYDGTWQHIQIPLNYFTEHGSWDNDTWYLPEGEFDWAAIDRFDIVSEYGNMGSAELWFDNIRILDPNLVSVENDNFNMNYELHQNYPNPFNPVTRIQYAVSEREFVTLKIYDILGNEIAVLVNEEKKPGIYVVEFNTESRTLASGIYFYSLQTSGFAETKKMILLK